MTTSLDLKLNKKILRKISKLGATMTLRSFPSQVDDDAQGTAVLGTPADQFVKGFGPFDYDEKYDPGELVKSGHSYFVLVPQDIKGVAIDPQPGATLLKNGKVWRVVTSRKITGGDDPAVLIVWVES